MSSPTPMHPSSEVSAASYEDVSSTCSASAPRSSGSSSDAHTCPYKDCKRSFSKKYNLKAHLRLHTGEEPFECDRPDCKKKFKWRSSLSSHSIWHTRKDSAATGHPIQRKPHPVKKEPTVKSESSLAAKVVVKSVTQPRSNNSVGAAPVKAVRKVGKAGAPAGNRSAFRVKVEESMVTIPSNANKKKRPRTEVTRKGNTSVPVQGSNAPSMDESSGTIPSLSDFCFSTTEGIDIGSAPTTAPGTPKAAKRKGSRPASKKRKTNSEANKKSGTAETSPAATVEANVDKFASPGSPVTSEGDLSEHSLGLDLFSCDVLPPLVGGESESLALGGEDVGGILSGEGDVGMFGYPSPSCGTLNGLDTRFGPFDLDNLQSFCLNKAERL